MNKTELIKQIATVSGLSQAQAGNALDAFCTVVADELGAGGEVSIVGFGAFGATTRPERMGRNPKTGAPVVIAERKAVKFKPGKTLKAALAG